MNHKIIYAGVVGSQAYGTSIATSDVDTKAVYLQTLPEILGFQYKPQYEEGKDHTAYEVRRFIELATSANPTILEMLFLPDDCIISISREFEPLREIRKIFLTKRCRDSFGGYAVQQIQKAKGLNKKMNWEESRIVRKDVLDFCYMHGNGKSFPVKEWLAANRFEQENCGLVALDHMPGCYAVYFNRSALYPKFAGIVAEDSNDVRLSSIPKGFLPEGMLYFNKDAYSLHCKEYKQYQTWLENRNTQRYVDTTTHGQRIDGKNMMHCRRLIETAIEIAETGELNVRRPNAADLLKIRRGEVPLEELIERSEEDIRRMDELYLNCNLPDDVDMKIVEDVLISIRL